jgi:hypothetical protein
MKNILIKKTEPDKNMKKKISPGYPLPKNITKNGKKDKDF